MNASMDNPLKNLLVFLHRLESTHIWYRLEHVRDSLMVMVSVPGQRWEIEFFADGSVEVERFMSAGKIENEDALENLFRDHGSSSSGG